jgi:hypothetical protein
MLIEQLLNNAWALFFGRFHRPIAVTAVLLYLSKSLGLFLDGKGRCDGLKQ